MHNSRYGWAMRAKLLDSRRKPILLISELPSSSAPYGNPSGAPYGHPASSISPEILAKEIPPINKARSGLSSQSMDKTFFLPPSREPSGLAFPATRGTKAQKLELQCP